jgi:archaellum component FlaC
MTNQEWDLIMGRFNDIDDKLNAIVKSRSFEVLSDKLGVILKKLDSLAESQKAIDRRTFRLEHGSK